MLQQRVRFLCTHNAARSPLAEGRLRHCGGDRFAAFSAGTAVSRGRPLAVEALTQIGSTLWSRNRSRRRASVGSPATR
jgi:arsenate reductase